jgi:hypothetical protein
VNAWNMCWIALGIRISSLNVEIPNSIMNANVVDLVEALGSWNWTI